MIRLMKHIWDLEELATHWSLSFEEMQLIKSKPARKHFQSVADRQVLDEADLQKRLILCLYGMGTNTGLKRISSS